MRKFWLLALPLSVFGSDLKEIVQDVQNNEMLASLGYAVKAQEKGRDAVVSAYLPKLNGNYMYQYIDSEQQGPFDPEQSGTLEASAIVFDGFRRSEMIMSKNSSIDSTKATKAHQKESLTLNTIKLYFSMKSVKANIEATKQKRAQLENEVSRLEKFYAAGSITEDKLEQVRAAFAMAEYELSLYQQNYQDLAFSLETLTGKPVSDLGESMIVEKEVVEDALTNDLASMQHTIDALDHDAKAKTADYWPTILIKDTFTATKYYEKDTSGYDATTKALLSAFEFPAATNKVQVVASMTLFDFFAKSNERQAVEMQKRAKEQELAYKKRDLAIKKRLAKIELKTVKSKIASSELSLKSSKKSYDFVAKQQKANLVDSSVYLDALTAFYQSKAMLIAAQNEYQIALANYYFNHAIPLEGMIK